MSEYDFDPDQFRRLMIDKNVLDRIATSLRGEWSWEMVDDIAAFVRASGREVDK